MLQTLRARPRQKSINFIKVLKNTGCQTPGTNGRLRCEGELRNQLAEKFRSAILRANANGEFFRDDFIELFPRGNCGIV